MHNLRLAIFRVDEKLYLLQVVPNYSSKEEYEKMFAKGVSM